MHAKLLSLLPLLGAAALLGSAVAPCHAALPGLSARRAAVSDVHSVDASSLPLSEAVRRDLAERDPTSYELADQLFASPSPSARGEDAAGNATTLRRRAPPNNLYGIKTVGNTPNSFVFSFDDGPYDQHRTIVDQLANRGAKGTFFVNGYNFACIYDQARVDAVRYAVSKGMDICAHTWGHVHLNQLTHAQIDKQIQLLEDALWKTAGVVPSCIRPPFGEANADVVNYLNNRWGYVVINWSQDARDAKGSNVADSMNVYRSLHSPTKAIVLNHETVATTPSQLLPQALNQVLGSGGYRSNNVVGVSGALGFNPYKVRGAPGRRDGSWTCADKPKPGQVA